MGNPCTGKNKHSVAAVARNTRDVIVKHIRGCAEMLYGIKLLARVFVYTPQPVVGAQPENPVFLLITAGNGICG